jgi:hypothetical protein
MSPVWNETTEYRLHYHNDLIQEFNAGAEIEFFDSLLNGWVSTSTPIWDEKVKYRIKSKTETVYELLICNDKNEWYLDYKVRSESEIRKVYGDRELNGKLIKTGRSFEVPV